MKSDKRNVHCEKTRRKKCIKKLYKQVAYES